METGVWEGVGGGHTPWTRPLQHEKRAAKQEWPNKSRGRYRTRRINRLLKQEAEKAASEPASISHMMVAHSVPIICGCKFSQRALGHGK